MLRHVRLSIFILWLSAACATGYERYREVKPNNEYDKEVLWIWYLVLDTPFRQAEEFLQKVSRELGNMRHKKQQLENSLNAVNGGGAQLFEKQTKFKDALSQLRKALNESIDIYTKLEQGVKDRISKMEKLTESEERAVGSVDAVVRHAWDITGSTPSGFRYLRNSFEIALKNKTSRDYEARAQSRVNDALKEDKGALNYTESLVRLLNTTAADYIDKVTHTVETILTTWKPEVIALVRQFVDETQGIRQEINQVGKEKGREVKRLEVQTAEKEVSSYVLGSIANAKKRHCSEFEKWLELRERQKLDERAEQQQALNVIEELRLLEEAIPAERLDSIREKFGGEALRDACGKWREYANDARNSSRLLKAYWGNISLVGKWRKMGIQKLMSNASATGWTWALYGECEGLRVEKELIKRALDEADGKDVANWSELCGNETAVCNEVGAEKVLTNLLVDMTSWGRSNSTAMIAENEKAASKNRTNVSSVVRSRVAGIMEDYKRRLLSDLNLVRRVSCAAQVSVAAEYRGMSELKGRLWEVKREINALHDVLDTQRSFGFTKGTPSTGATSESDTLLPLLEVGERRLSKCVKNEWGKVALAKIESLPEQVGRSNTGVGQVLGCRMEFGGVSVSGQSGQTLIATIRDHIELYDSFRCLERTIASERTRLRRLLVRLNELRSQLEAEANEMKRTAECKPVWWQLLQLIQA
ncbi:hypothetical protein ERJ75_000577200 [Trypanosoma vivax]|nr:hypothetical protein ERJ75_000577200 [Trypanosoma vivax]